MSENEGRREKDAAAIDVAAQLAELELMQVRHLQVRYVELFGVETRSRNRDYLLKKLAWKIQERAEGGLSERAKERLAELAKEPPPMPQVEGRRHRAKKQVDVLGRDPRLPKPGTILTRAHGGIEHQVTVLDEGFEYQGELFSSLSAIAKKIAGTSWNGWKFFKAG